MTKHKLMTGLLLILVSVFQLQDTTKMLKPAKHTNQLIHSTSPYLLQHAHNPVDWYEWGETALEKAKSENKPILVSIGYSSCHWCHVMERESFENEAIAQIMNEHFICIKVDREERPDIDQVYMDAVQAMGLGGGWPLNVFLTSDQKPFYGGTYFPPNNWKQVLNNLANAYRTKRLQIETSAEELITHLQKSDIERFRSTPNTEALEKDLNTIYAHFIPTFDTTWGGFQRDANKFVMPSIWQWLLRYYHLTQNHEALNHVVFTLKKISMGGIHDQVRGGFARYAVDPQWFAPHFEKMLYDNAQLMSLYAEAYSVTYDQEFKKVVEGIFSWLTEEMTHEEGGFFSALDADSEGEEGKFYVWTYNEFHEILGKDGPLLSEYYGVTPQGNWENGQNILVRKQSTDQFLQNKTISPEKWEDILYDAHQKLLQARNLRPRPGLDDKIITAWNAMMIAGLVDAYKYLGEAKYLQAALKNLHFLETKLIDKEIIYRSFKGTHSNTIGFLDDYASIIQAYIQLYQVTFQEDYLKTASKLLDYSINQFFDEREGYFHYTQDSEENLIVRKKEVFDNVIPSSNAYMARNLSQLGLLMDNETWTKQGEKMVSGFSNLIRKEPGYMSYWGIVLLETKQPIAEVIIVGNDLENFRNQWQKLYYPFSVTLGTRRDSHLPLLEGKGSIGEKTTLFVCFNKTCKQPVFSVAAAEKQIIKSINR